MLRPPAWFIYPVLLLVLLLAALGRRTHADSPPPPPALPSPERDVLAETTPIDPAAVVRVRAKHGPDAGTAFSVGDAGVWLTAQASLADCARPAVLVNDLEGVAAHPVPGPGGRLTVLVSARGAPALSLASVAPPPGALAFAPGFPHGRPGEVAVHLLGRRVIRAGDRENPRVTTLVWAEMGRTEGLTGALSGLAGAPLLDGEGRVVGARARGSAAARAALCRHPGRARRCAGGREDAHARSGSRRDDHRRRLRPRRRRAAPPAARGADCLHHPLTPRERCSGEAGGVRSGSISRCRQEAAMKSPICEMLGIEFPALRLQPLPRRGRRRQPRRRLRRPGRHRPQRRSRSTPS